MSLKNKLNRLKPYLSTGIENRENDRHSSTQTEVRKNTIPYLEIWEQENVNPYFFDDNYCLIRKVVYPLSYQHGKYLFSDAMDAIKGWNEAEIKHPLSAVGHQPNDLFFFDTETTGLGGGAGNTIFLLGYATIKNDSVVLMQHLLPHPGSEVALYQSFLESIDYTTLVTYNGKAFDWPQVKTRHTLVRDHVPKLPSFGHFDLYHAARRMWKHKIDRMKLSNVEKDVLGFKREDDIPGYLAPMIYFDFLERKHPEGILGIMKHNELDILSLISLYTHLSFQLLGTDTNRTVRETYEVGRWYSYLGERKMAQEHYENIATSDDEAATFAKHALAYEYKRNKNWSKAIDLWKISAEKSKQVERIEACIELAKVYEHQFKDYSKAIQYSERGENQLHLIENEKKRTKLTAELLKRKKRLLTKNRKKKG